MWSPCGKLRPCGCPRDAIEERRFSLHPTRRDAAHACCGCGRSRATCVAVWSGAMSLRAWAHRRERRRHRVPVAALRRAEAAGRLPAALLLGVRRPRLPQRNRISMQHATCNMQHTIQHTTRDATHTMQHKTHTIHHPPSTTHRDECPPRRRCCSSVSNEFRPCEPRPNALSHPSSPK